MKKAPVAVLILNWNGKDLLRACLRTWKRSSPAPARLLVVDNGSGDGSVAMVRREFKGVEVLALPENLGFAAGNNRGFEYLRRKGPKVEAVLACNNDTEVEAGMLGRLWEALKANPGWGFAGPRILFHGQDRVWFEGGAFRKLSGRPYHLGHGEAPGPAGRPFALGQGGFITGCALMVRSGLLKSLGGFDEAFWAYAEDSDLCLRGAALGYGCGVVPAARMTHKVSSSFSLGSAQAMYYITRNSMVLLKRHRLGSPLAFGAWSGLRALKALALGGPGAALAVIQGLKDALDGRLGLRPG